MSGCPKHRDRTRKTDRLAESVTVYSILAIEYGALRPRTSTVRKQIPKTSTEQLV